VGDAERECTGDAVLGLVRTTGNQLKPILIFLFADEQ
jgi:hypothetical protein